MKYLPLLWANQPMTSEPTSPPAWSISDSKDMRVERLSLGMFWLKAAA